LSKGNALITGLQIANKLHSLALGTGISAPSSKVLNFNAAKNYWHKPNGKNLWNNINLWVLPNGATDSYDLELANLDKQQQMDLIEIIEDSTGDLHLLPSTSRTSVRNHRGSNHCRCHF